MNTSKKTASVFGLASARKSNGRPKTIDPDLLVVEHDYKLPKGRMVEGKFDALFRQMRPGSAVKCEPSEVATLCNTLRKAIQAEKYPALAGCVVRQVTRAPDGRGRVVAVLKAG